MKVKLLDDQGREIFSLSYFDSIQETRYGWLVDGKTVITPPKFSQITWETEESHPLTLGLKPDKKDERDYEARDALEFSKSLPNSLSYRDEMTSVKDQGQMGSCTSHALVSVREWQERLDSARMPIEDLSELFLYQKTKEIDDWPNEQGTTFRFALKALKRWGICMEKFYPYRDDWPIETEPPWHAYGRARWERIKSYHRLRSLGEIKQWLVEKGPCVLGIPVGFLIFDPPNNVVPPPKFIIGGHGVCLTGFKGDKLEFKNSWGCYDEETEILTRDGWKLFQDLEEEEKVATLNPETQEMEWQKIEKKFVYNFNGELHHYLSRDLDLMVTPNHQIYFKSWRAPSWQLKPSRDIKIKNIQMKKNAEWKGNNPEYYKVGDKLVPFDLWVEFLGYFLSEGHTRLNQFTRSPRWRTTKYKVKAGKRRRDPETGRFLPTLGWKTILKETEPHLHSKTLEKNYITGISQSTKNETIESCLRKLPWKFSFHNGAWTTNNKDLFLELKDLGKAPEKFIPKTIKESAPRYLRILLEAMMLGDGSGEPLKKWTYYTSSKQLADDVQEIAMKIGYAADITVHDRRGRENSGGITRFKEYHIGIKTKETEQHFHLPKVRRKRNYSGKVYCVRVPNHIIYVRRNGKAVWSGNSNWASGGYAWLREDYLDKVPWWVAWGMIPDLD